MNHYEQDGQDFQTLQTVKVFAASSGELQEEREVLIQVVHSVNKVFAHLKLEVLEWETDLESGSYQKDRVQDEINPLLEASHIVIVIFFSKTGKFTLEEYHLAREKKKKVFLYFKKGFSPNNLLESKNYLEVLEFRAGIETENKALFRDYENRDQFINLVKNDLTLYLKKAFPAALEARIPKYLTALPAKTVDLVGREKELKEMARLLECSDRVLLVNGLGGVGKTELCKGYFRDNIDHYNHLAWVDMVGNTGESFVRAFAARVVGGSASDTPEERFDKIVGFLKRLDKHSLLVVDNVENQTDKDLDKVLRFPFKVVVSSRLQLAGFKKYDLDFLSTAACKELFYGFYKGKRDDMSLERIIALAGSHTLTVELLARTAQNSAASLADFLKTLEKEGFNLNKVIPEKVETLWDKAGEKEKFFNHLLKIFDLSRVTEAELHILANLSVLPAIYIPIPDVSEWLKLESKEDINSLVFKGWLKQEEGDFNIYMHQVIQEVTRYKTAPGVETCKSLIRSLTGKLYLEAGENPLDKKKYVIFAETLLRHIDKNIEALADLSNNLAEIYLHMGSLEKALEFQLRALKIREEVLDKNHPSLATSYNNLSLIYSDLGQAEKALEFQLKALKIFEEILDKNHPDLAASYNNLAEIYRTLGQAEKALEFQLKALKIREEVLDKNHPDLATSYNNLSLIYKALGQAEKALEFQLKDLKISEQVLDKNHPDLATSYNNLALVYQDLQDYEPACRYGEKAVAILQQLFPHGHPNLDQAKRNLEGIKKSSKKMT